MEATQRTPSGQPLSPDDWLASVTGRSRRWDVPLIPLERLGILHDEDGLTSSSMLVPLTPGAEASPFFDKEWKAVYKLFDLRANGSLGKKIDLVPNSEAQFDLLLCDAVLQDTLEKLSVLNEAGALPTEIVGLSESGDYLLVKQPLAFPRGAFEADRKVAINAVRGVTPPFTGLRRTVVVIWVDNRAWLVSDLHDRNIMRDSDGLPTIIDALIGPVPPAALRHLQWLREAVEDSQALREGLQPKKRKQFEDVDNDEL